MLVSKIATGQEILAAAIKWRRAELFAMGLDGFGESPVDVDVALAINNAELCFDEFLALLDTRREVIK